MKQLIDSYGRLLTTLFVLAVGFWALLLIVLPQGTILERALTLPKRQLDSSVAATLRGDAVTCMSVLGNYLETDAKDATQNGGLAIPSMNSAPKATVMAVPSFGASATASRPYILQCDRANTHQRLSRDADEAWLDEAFDLPPLRVIDTDPVARQIDQAGKIRDMAEALATRLRTEEAQRSNLSLNNFRVLVSATRIPLSAEMKAAEDAALSNRLYGLLGLRFEQDGQVYERLGLTNLTRTLFFAVMVTGLALLICYPIAFKAALATPADRQIWLMLGLIIPYAIVELMRIYAWTTIIDNQGLINAVLVWAGLVTEPIQFTRMPGTVFVVIAYTYVLFMVFPMLNVMSTLDRNQLEAARDLGASSWRMHRRVVIPHAKAGIAVGCISTFMLAAGAFSVPRIISRGLQAEWFSQTIYNKFFESENSNVGAAYSLAYTVVCFGLVALFMWAMRTRLRDFARVQ
jgi:ABC-type spermidine/putrescine transport system permease subunit I